MISLRLNQYIPFKPFPKQAAFLCLDQYQEILFGGAAGGGKTIALLMCALQYFDTKGYAALLLRKNRSEMDQPGGLIFKSREWLTGKAKWNGQTNTWTSPEGGALKFGYVSNDADLFTYQSGEYQFVGIDEATQLTEYQHRFLFSRVRKTESLNVPMRLRYCSNPGGPSHKYFKERFMDTPPSNCLYIPSQIGDNPALDKEDYINNKLSHLDPLSRARFLEGDWNIREGGNMFIAEWFRDLVPEPPAGIRFVRAWDLAATEVNSNNTDPDWTAGVLMGFDPRDKSLYVVHVAKIRGTPKVVEDFIRKTAISDRHLYGNVQIVIEQEKGSAGKGVVSNYQRNVLMGFPARGWPVTGSKIERASPFSSQCEASNVILIRAEWNRAYLDELTMFPSGGHDDVVDASSLAFIILTANVNFTNISKGKVLQKPDLTRPTSQGILTNTGNPSTIGSGSSQAMIVRPFGPQSRVENPMSRSFGRFRGVKRVG